MYIYTYIHTYIHTYIYIYNPSWAYVSLFDKNKRYAYLIYIFEFATFLNTGVYVDDGSETEWNAIWS